MAIALWTLLLAVLMPIVCAGIAKVGPGRYDNRNPRDCRRSNKAIELVPMQRSKILGSTGRLRCCARRGVHRWRAA